VRENDKSHLICTANSLTGMFSHSAGILMC